MLEAMNLTVCKLVPHPTVRHCERARRAGLQVRGVPIGHEGGQQGEPWILRRVGAPSRLGRVRYRDKSSQQES